MYLADRLLDEYEEEIRDLKIENENLVSEVVALILENITIKNELYDLKQSIIKK
jgi:regulator of replication initiation timing